LNKIPKQNKIWWFRIRILLGVNSPLNHYADVPKPKNIILTKVVAISRLIRFPNLLIVGLTQLLLGWILYGALSRRALDGYEFGLLILATVFIAAAGYVINDIYDRSIDEANKPEKVIVGRYISIEQAWVVYWGLVGVGFLVAAYLAWAIDDFWQLLIYPVATVVLWAYAKTLKKSFIAGNIVVAAYCAFVPGILWYAERMYLGRLPAQETGGVRLIFIVYAVMAFLTTVWREIIKDMEDMTGDKVHGSKSLPVRYGLPLAQKIAFFLGGITFLLVGYYWIYLGQNGVWMEFGYLFIPLIINALALVKSMHSVQPGDLHLVSRLIKLLMVFGLGYLFFLV